MGCGRRREDGGVRSLSGMIRQLKSPLDTIKTRIDPIQPAMYASLRLDRNHMM
jgi:hypothetical protein